MATQLYAGNLNYGMTDDSLKQLFESHGEVVSAKIIRDRATGKSKGFGFIEMSSDTEAESAIEILNGSEVEGRNIRVNFARPKKEKTEE